MKDESTSLCCKSCGKAYAHFGYSDTTGVFQMKTQADDLQMNVITSDPLTMSLVCTCGVETVIPDNMLRQLRRV